MPFGEYQYSVDDKGRVIIPPSFRPFIEDGMVVTRGMEGCLYIFSLTHWSKIAEKLDELPIIDTPSRHFVRFFYSGAAKASTDSNGRITIPATLRAFAGIEGNVVIAGAPNRLEIWNEERWRANLDAILGDPPAPELLRELVG